MIDDSIKELTALREEIRKLKLGNHPNESCQMLASRLVEVEKENKTLKEKAEDIARRQREACALALEGPHRNEFGNCYDRRNIVINGEAMSLNMKLVATVFLLAAACFCLWNIWTYQEHTGNVDEPCNPNGSCNSQLLRCVRHTRDSWCHPIGHDGGAQ
jgi:hypothetical protein